MIGRVTRLTFIVSRLLSSYINRHLRRLPNWETSAVATRRFTYPYGNYAGRVFRIVRARPGCVEIVVDDGFSSPSHPRNETDEPYR